MNNIACTNKNRIEFNIIRKIFQDTTADTSTKRAFYLKNSSKKARIKRPELSIFPEKS